MTKMIALTLKCALTAILAAGSWLYVYDRPARAQVAPNTRALSFEQVSLTRDMLKRFLASFPEIQSRAKKYSKELSAAGDPMGYARRDMEDFVKSYGYRRYADWIRVTKTVALTYGFAKTGAELNDLAEQTKLAIAKIENNPKLSMEQKAQYKAMISANMGVMARFLPKPENFALVKSMMPEIAATMDEN